ncbi:hypothetical protein ACOME3_001155 [Neoechinorhynchus agilis]
MGNKKSRPIEPTPKLIKMLSTSAQCNEQIVMDSYKRFISYTPSGLMDKKTFVGRFQTKYPGANVKLIADIVFKYFDTDHSGKISFSEYFLPSVFMALIANPSQRSEILFNIFDSDDNNVITEKELKLMVQALYELRGEAVDKSKINEVATTIATDMDCDGNRKITQEEFVYALGQSDTMRRFLDFNFGDL